MKTIQLINYNNRLATDVFIHIAAAPGSISESKLPVPVMVEEIGTAIFPAELIDFARCHLYELNSITTYLSHGKSREEFMKDYLSIDGHDQLDQIAIFIYKKI